MASVKPDKLKLFEVLKQRPRTLGEANELVLLGQGPGCVLRLIFAVCLLICVSIGVLRGMGDLAINLTGSQTTGRVTDVVYTNTQVNEEDLYRVYFEYAPAQKAMTTFCYALDYVPEEGQEVKVHYSSIWPRFARIERTTMGSLGGTIGFLIVAVVLGFLGLFGLKGFRKTLQWRRLLREGLPNWALLISKHATNVEINDNTQYKLTFAFEVSGQTHEIIVKEHRQAELHALEDEAEELMLYDPDNPAFAVIWDALPVKLRLDRNGVFQSPKSKDLIWSIVLILFTYGSIFYGLNAVVKIFTGG